MSPNSDNFTSLTGVNEYYYSLTSTPASSFLEEAQQLLSTYATESNPKHQEIFLRFHLSNISEQIHIIKNLLKKRAEKLENQHPFISYIEQAPVNGAKIAMEAWHWDNKKTLGITSGTTNNRTITLQNYKMLFFHQENVLGNNSYHQMYDEFIAVEKAITAKGGNIPENLQRTWIYCLDVDNNYAGLVVGRNDFFNTCGLTSNTHFITSTGIEGKGFPPSRIVSMDSWALFGHQAEQIEYMHAPDNMCPTHNYGVAFERGIRILYGDRSVYYISGTASIDKNGDVLHIGDVRKQTHRAVENISTMLQNHQGNLSDIKQAIVYLRHANDAQAVTEELAKTPFAQIPYIMVKAPVCRPTWLVEIEGIAINEQGNARFAPLQ